MILGIRIGRARPSRVHGVRPNPGSRRSGSNGQSQLGSTGEVAILTEKRAEWSLIRDNDNELLNHGACGCVGVRTRQSNRIRSRNLSSIDGSNHCRGPGDTAGAASSDRSRAAGASSTGASSTRTALRTSVAADSKEARLRAGRAAASRDPNHNGHSSKPQLAHVDVPSSPPASHQGRATSMSKGEEPLHVHPLPMACRQRVSSPPRDLRRRGATLCS